MFSLLSVTAIKLSLCVIYKLNFIISIYVYEKNNAYMLQAYPWLQIFPEGLGKETCGIMRHTKSGRRGMSSCVCKEGVGRQRRTKVAAVGRAVVSAEKNQGILGQ
jgi:hypothetical protein